MTLLKRLQRFLRSVPARANGTHLPASNDNVVRLAARAPTVPKEDTAKLGQKWIEDQDDYRPIG